MKPNQFLLIKFLSILPDSQAFIKNTPTSSFTELYRILILFKDLFNPYTLANPSAEAGYDTKSISVRGLSQSFPS